MKQNSQVKIQNETPLVSVIVPVYKTEKYLRRCLDSIIWQSYKNIELICVDDASPDGCAAILDGYVNSKPPVTMRVVTHTKNMGLFAARLSGVKEAKGDYIMFVDSDDHISCDWVRTLLYKMEEDESDIVIGQWVYEDEDGKRSYLNLDPLRTPIKLEGGEIINRYMSQEGSCFSWQLAWNKIYRYSLWRDALSELEKFSADNPDFTMCEDMAFSIAMWLRAKKVTNITAGAIYFYCRNSTQSTNMSAADSKSVERKLNNVFRAFEFMRQELLLKGLFEKYESHYNAWKLHYAKTYNKNGKGDGKFEKKIRSLLGIDDNTPLDKETADDWYFYSIQTECEKAEQWLEEIKINICYGKVKVISFDIFDTLLVRPFFYPSDLFCLMNKDLRERLPINSFVDFSKIRIEAEKNCRQTIKNKSYAYEEITLDEIYEKIKNDYNFPDEALEYLKNKELEYELKYCYPRRTAKQLYELAKQQGKTIIFTSDMYLPETFVKKLLEKNGYFCDRLYLSSSTRITKWSGNMYKFISDDMGLQPQDYLHIGDNWHSDIENAQSCGWEASHIANTVDMLKGANPGIYSGTAFRDVYNNPGLMQDTVNTFEGFLGLRCAAAMVANMLFDNPFVTINRQTDYNANAYAIGYSAVGTYLFAVTHWIADNAAEKKSSSVQFVARDGYIPMRAYEIFRRYFPALPESNYLYISRKSLCLTDVAEKYDLYSLINKLNIFCSSPEKLCSMFKEYLTVRESELIKLSGLTKGLFTQQFKSRISYEQFLKVLGEHIDFKKLKAHNARLKSYFGSFIKPGSLLFDIGYSGRGESSLSRMLGYPVNSMYMHSNNDLLNNRMAAAKFGNCLFYDYKPRITGVVREHVFMKLAPSVVGYIKTADGFAPEFEELKINASTDTITRVCQNAALEFVENFLQFFGNDLDIVAYRRTDMALPFEYYLHYSKETDRKLFSCIEFEDDFGLGKKVNAFDFWNQDLAVTNLIKRGEVVYNTQIVEVDRVQNFSKFKKALYYFLFDNKTFWKKLRKKY